MNDQIKSKMEKVLSVVEVDMNTVRAGTAKPSLVENLIVTVYGGQKMRLMELASIQSPEPTLITISPWDKSIIKDIEKAFSESDLGLSAANAGDFIRIVIPPLTEERRLDCVKLIKQKLESGRVMVRSVRQEEKDRIEAQKGKPGISEDDITNELEELDKMTAEYTAKLEAMASGKENELMRLSA